MITAEIKNLFDAVTKTLNNVAVNVTNIPDRLFNAARERSQEVVTVANSAAATLKTSQDAVVEAFNFFSYWMEQYRKWNPGQFKANLISFLNDVFQLPGEASRVLLDIKWNIDKALATEIIDHTPNPVLYGLSHGLQIVPDWQSKGKQLYETAKQIPSISEVNDEACQKVLQQDSLNKVVERTHQLAPLLSSTLELAIRHLPRDLSVNASVVGEGGGTQVAGHPAKVPLEWAKWSVDLADKMFKKYLDFCSACKAAEKAKQDAVWKQDVISRLDRIEKKS